MKLLFLLMLCMSHSAAEIYIYCTKYTAATGIAGLPEFTATSFLHGKQIDYYDSTDRTLLPRQEWSKRILGEPYWEKTTRLRFSESIQLQQELSSVMESSGHTEGIHTFQRMYGCLWDDSTGHSDGFDVYGYDGHNFLSLDLNSRKFTALVPQAKSIAQEWNQNTTLLEILQLYYKLECVAWLKTFFSEEDRQHDRWRPTLDYELRAIVVPILNHYLKRSYPPAVMCHARGLSSSSVRMSWQRNKKDFDINGFVIVGDTLPSGDGSFQKTIYLFVGFEDLMQNQYQCVLEYVSLAGESLIKMSQNTELQFSYGAHHRASHSKWGWGSYDEDEYDEDYDEDDNEEEEYDDDEDVWQDPYFHKEKF